jgi:hypothetical protein
MAAGESLFEVKTPTPAADRIQILRIGEDAMRSLVIGSTDIAWPAVVGGQGSGGCGAFLSADRKGNVREVFPAGCDNPSLEEPLHQALLKWNTAMAQLIGTRKSSSTQNSGLKINPVERGSRLGLSITRVITSSLRALQHNTMMYGQR